MLTKAFLRDIIDNLGLRSGRLDDDGNDNDDDVVSGSELEPSVYGWYTRTRE
jgi:hypothetical protein